MLVVCGESVAVGAGFDDVGFVGDAVDDGGGEAGVGEGFGPFGEGGVGGDGDGCSFFAFGEDLEEEFGGVLVEVDVAEFVDGEEFVAAVFLDDAGEVVVVFGLAEFVGELCAGGVADSSAVLSGGEAGGDEEMGFPGA